MGCMSLGLAGDIDHSSNGSQNPWFEGMLNGVLGLVYTVGAPVVHPLKLRVRTTTSWVISPSITIVVYTYIYIYYKS